MSKKEKYYINPDDFLNLLFAKNISPFEKLRLYALYLKRVNKLKIKEIAEDLNLSPGAIGLFFSKKYNNRARIFVVEKLLNYFNISIDINFKKSKILREANKNENK